jgi:Mn2+/Fe2+ NRAMP family transporter
MLAIPVMAGASAYAISESIGSRRPQGLNQKLKQASTFYGVIIISMFLGLAMNFIGLNPIKALIYSAVLNGIVAPIIIVLILLLARNHKVMGDWKNGKTSSVFGWIMALLMGASGIAAIYSLFP